MALLDGFRSRRNRGKGGETSAPPRIAPRRLGIMALEPRIMYDAAAAATANAAAQTHQDGAADPAAAAAADKQAAPASNTGAPAAGGDRNSPAQAANVQTPAPASTPDISKPNSSLDASSTAPASTAAPREVVFIDPQSADLMNLYGGVKDSDLVFVLDPSRDGVQQIVDILAAQNLHDLDAIHIVSHGLEAQVRLGTTVLSENNVDDHAAALAAIGAALNADGDILLYGCDVAAGTDGAQFIADLARLTGADIAASTDQTGSTDLGGNWTLEAATGAIAATMPFTDATLASYEGLLAVSFSRAATDPIGQINAGVAEARMISGDFDGDGDMDFLYQAGNTAGSGFGYLRSNGDGTYTKFAPGNLAGTPFATTDFTGQQMTALFVGDYDGDGDVDIIDRDPSGGMGVWRNDNGSLVRVATDPIGQINAGVAEGRMIAGDFDRDGDMDFLYQAGNTAGSGFGYLRSNGNGTYTKFTPGNLAGTPFATTDFTGQQLTALFVGDYDGDGDVDIIDRDPTGGMGVWRNDNGSLVRVATDPIGQINAGVAEGRMIAGDFDSDGDMDFLYQAGNTAGAGFGYLRSNGDGTYTKFTPGNLAGTPFATTDFTGQQLNSTAMFVGDYDGDRDVDIVDRDVAGGLGVFVQGSNSGGDGHPPRLTSSTPSDNSTGVLPGANITLTFSESVTRGTGNIYIVRTSDNTVVETIAVGSAQVTGSGTSWTIDPSITLDGGTSYAVRADARTFVDSDGAVFFGIKDNTTLNFKTTSPPVLTLGGSGTPTYTEQGTAASALDGSLHVTATDADNTQLAGATISIANAQLGDKLFYSGTLPAGITVSGSSTDTSLVLTGAANLAAYEQAFELITFSSTSDNPTNYGPATSRTLNYVVTDGVTSSNSVSTSVSVIAVNDAPVNHLPGAATFTEDTAAAITGLSVTDVDSNPAVDSMQVVLAVQHGVLTVQAAAGVTIAGNNSATVTLTGTQNAINAALAAASGLTYLGTLNYNGADTLTMTTSDQGHTGTPGALQDLDTVAITVNAKNDAPDLTPNSPSSPSYFVGFSAPAALLAGGAVSDIDNPTDFSGGGFTVAVTNSQAGDQIALLASSGFTTSGTSLMHNGNAIGTVAGLGSATVTVTALTSFATPAEVNALVQAFAFQTTGSAGNRTVTLSFSDGGNTGGGALTDSVTQTVQVRLPNQAPTLTLNVATVTAPEQTATALAPALDLTDADSTTLQSATVQITTGYVSGEDVLAFTNTAKIQGTFNAANGTLTLTAIAGQTPSENDFKLALQSVTYRNTSDAPSTASRTVVFTVQDPDGTTNGGIDTTTASATISVTPVNDAPALSQTSNTVGYAENGSPVQLLPAEVLSDPDLPANFNGGFVQVTLANSEAGDGIGLLAGSNFSVDGSNNVLDGATVIGTVHAGTGFGTTSVQIDLNSNATAAEVSGLLKALSYASSSEGPGTTARIATVTVDDGGNTGSGSRTAVATVTINVTPANDPVTASVPGPQTVAEDSSVALTGLSISDIDASFPSGASGLYSVTLSAGHGTLTLATTSGLTFDAGTSNGTATLTFHGTLAAINTALASASYAGDANYNGADSIAVSVTDSFNNVVATGSGAATTDSRSIAVTVTAVNDPVTATAPGLLSVAEDASVAIAGLSIGDVDATLAPGGIYAVTLSASHGTLTLGSTSGVTFDSGTANGTAILSFHGTLADINAALATASYAGNANYNGADSISFVVTDQSGADIATGIGGPSSDTRSVAVTVTATNDAVTALAPGSAGLAEDTSMALTGLSIGDVDAALAPGGIYAVTLTASHGTLTLGSTSGLTFDGGTANGTATLTFHGTLADINAALLTASYAGNTDFNGADSIAFTVTDSFNAVVATGSGSATSDTKSIAVTVTAANDQVTVAAPGPVSLAEDGSTALTGLSIGDVDAALAPGGIYAVTLSAGHGRLTLGNTSGLVFDSGTANGTATLTFHGTLADINAALATASYAGNADYNGTDSIAVSVTDEFNSVIATGGGSATSDADSIAVTITAVNDPVAAAAPATASPVAGQSSPIAGLSISDVDAVRAPGGLYEVTLTADNGTLTLGGITGLLFTNGSGANNTTMTFQGTLADIDAALAGLTYNGDVNHLGVNHITFSVTDDVNGTNATGAGAATSDSRTINLNVLSPTTLDLDADNSSGATGKDYSALVDATHVLPVAVVDADVSIVDAAGTGVPSATIVLVNPDSGDFLRVGADTAALTSSGTLVVNGKNVAWTRDITTNPGQVTVQLSEATLTASDMQAALKLITFERNGTSTANRHIDISLGGSTAATTTVYFHTLDLDSTAGGSGYAATFTEGGAAVPIAGANVAITDPDSGVHIASATITLTNAQANDILTVGDLTGLGITAASTSNQIVLTGSGTSTAADFQAALQLIRFSNSSDHPGTVARDITVVVTDDNATPSTTNVARATIHIHEINDAPVIAAASSAQSAVEDQPLIFSAAHGNAIILSDPDNATLTVTLSALHGTITLSGTAGLTVNAGANGSGSLQVTGSIAQLNAALEGLRYQGNPDFNGADVLSIVSVDSGTTNGAPDPQTAQVDITLTVTTVNDPVTVSAPPSFTASEDISTPITGLSISDVDATFASGTAGIYSVTLSATNGTLTLGSTTNLTFTTGTGTSNATMTFHGTLADINAALATASYRGNADFNGTDSIVLSATDLFGADVATGVGGATSDSRLIAVTVNAVNDQVSATAPTSATLAEDGSVPVTGLSISDVDATLAPGGIYAVTLTASHGALTLGSSSGLTFDAGTSNGTATLTFHGTLANLNTALATLSYAGNADFNGIDNIGFTVTDQFGAAVATGSGAATGDSKSIGITITAANDAVTAAAPASLTANEDSATPISGLSIGDVDATLAPGGIYAVTLSATSGTLTLGSTTNLTFTSGTGTSNATMTFHGTLADINAALATASYRGNADFNGTDSIVLSATDQFGVDVATGAGGATSDSRLIAVTVNAVNDQVSATAPTSATLAEDGSVPVTGLSISDVDATLAPGGIYAVTLTASHGALTLGSSSGLTFDAGTSNGTATLTFHGTLANLNTALATLSYAGNADFNGIDNIGFTVTDQFGAAVATGSGAATGDSKSIGIIVTAENDPVTAAAPANLTANEDSATPISGLSIGDVDATLAPGGIYAVTLSATSGTLTLGNTTNLTFTTGTGTSNATMTFHGTLADINAALATASYRGNADFNGTDSIVLSATDQFGADVATGVGGATSAGRSIAVTVNAVNDPVTATAPASVSLAEDSSVAVTGLSISDVDATRAPGGIYAVTLTASHGTLTLGSSSGLAFDVGSGAADHTMTFHGTLSDVNAALATLSYAGNANFNGASVIQFTVADSYSGTVATGIGSATSDTRIINVSTTGVNDAPTVVAPTAVSAATIPEDSPSATGDTVASLVGASFSDATDSQTASGGTAANTLAGVAITGDAATAAQGTWQYFNGTDWTDISTAVSDANALVLSAGTQIRFNPAADFNGAPGALTVHLIDGSQGAVTSGTSADLTVTGGTTPYSTATVTIGESVTAVNDAPVLSGVAPSTAFTPGGPAVTLSSALSVSDVDNSTLAGATVRVTGGTFLGDGDVLSINGLTAGNIGSINFSYNAGTETLTLTGTDTLANYQQALELVKFQSTSFNPTNSGANSSRTITWQLNDGSGAGNQNLSTPVTSQVFLHTLDLDANNSTSVGNGFAATYTESGAPVPVADTDVLISDSDTPLVKSALITLTNARATDVLSINGTLPTGISVSSYVVDAINGTITLTLSGAASTADYQSALHQVVFSSTSTNIDTTNRVIDIVVTDNIGIATNPAQSTISIVAVNDPPALDAHGGGLVYTENDSPASVDPLLTLEDLDSTNIQGATVKITGNLHAGEDVLGFVNQNGISGSYDAASGTLTLTGLSSIANYEAALRSVTYFNTSDNPSAQDRTISYRAVDDGGAGSPVVTATVSVTPVNDAPLLSGLTPNAGYTENGSPVGLSPGVVLADLDGTLMTGATVSIFDGFFAGDTLAAVTAGTGITASYDSASGVLTLSGQDTLLHYQQVLASITFASTSDNPDNYGTQPTRTILWSITDLDQSSAAHANASTIATTTIDVTAINDAPTLDTHGRVLGYTENDAATAITPSLTLVDLDSLTLTGASVQISGNFHAGEDVLGFTSQSGISGSYDAATGVLTLTGVASVANYEAALRSVTYFNSSENPSAQARTISYQVADDVGAASAVATATVAVTPVNDAPVISSGNVLAFDANNGREVALYPAITLHDVDSTTLASAHVSIAGGFDPISDRLGFVNQNGITGSYDSATGILTLSGVASLADYQAALASVSFISTAQSDGVRSIAWTVDDGSSQFSQSLPHGTTTTVNVTGLIPPPHTFVDNSPPPASPFATPAALAFDSTRGPLAPPVGEDLGAGRAGFSYHIVHSDPVLTTASDYNVQIKLALVALEAPLGGDIVYVSARQANGDPLPDWLKFDPATGTFAGLPPDGMFASIEGSSSSDDIATGALPPNPDLGVAPAPAPAGPAARTITVQVQARDSSGNIAVTTFTIDLRPRAGGKQGWNMDWQVRPTGGERQAGLPMMSPELAAIEAAVRDVIRPSEPPGWRIAPGGGGEPTAAGSGDIAAPGRAGLTEQLASIGWRSMEAQRNALLASLQQYR